MLAWEFSSHDGISLWSRARARTPDASSRGELCRNLRFFLYSVGRKSYVMAQPLLLRSEKGIRRGIYTQTPTRRTARRRTDLRLLRRPFRGLKQPVKVSGMRARFLLRSQTFSNPKRAGALVVYRGERLGSSLPLTNRTALGIRFKSLIRSL